MNRPGAALQPLDDLLVLAERLPYPPEQAATLRAAQMLKFLSARYRVHLGCFHDPRADLAQLGKLRALCYETCFVERPALGARLRSLGAAAAGQPAPPPYYRNRTLAAWVERLLLRHPVGRALALSAPMAQYLMHATAVRRVVDLSAPPPRGWPLARIDRRQAAAQLAYERAVVGRFDAAAFDSPAAAARFGDSAPESRAKLACVADGVDADYFSPHIVHRSPYPPGVEALVSGGALDCQAGIEAAEWFARSVFAPLQAGRPSLRWYLLGGRTDARLQALARRPGVVVTGALADLRPYLAHAALAVVPLWAAGGRANLLLEAMAMQKIVVASAQPVAAIGARGGAELLLAGDEHDFIAHIDALLAQPNPRGMALAARARVLSDYLWSERLACLCGLLDGPAREPAR